MKKKASNARKRTTLLSPNRVDQIRDYFKRAALNYVDFTEQIADRIAGLSERFVATVKETPLYSPLKYQQDLSRRAMDFYFKNVRSLISAI